jgi:hypothetical protein
MGRAKTDDFACTGLVPVSLSSGSVVGPGEHFHLDLPLDAHDQRLVDAELIVQIGDTPDELADLNRDELNAHAAALGLTEPEGYKTKADLVAAIKAAGTGGSHDDQNDEVA